MNTTTPTREKTVIASERQWRDAWARLVAPKGMTGWHMDGLRLTHEADGHEWNIEPAWNDLRPAVTGMRDDAAYTGEGPWFTLILDGDNPKELARLAATLLEGIRHAGAQGFADKLNHTPYPFSHTLHGIELHADKPLLHYYNRPAGTWKLTTHAARTLEDADARQAWFGLPCRRPDCQAPPMQAYCVNQCAICAKHMCEECTSRCVECGQLTCDGCATIIDEHGDRQCSDCTQAMKENE